MLFSSLFLFLSTFLFVLVGSSAKLSSQVFRFALTLGWHQDVEIVPLAHEASVSCEDGLVARGANGVSSEAASPIEGEDARLAET